MKAPIMQHIAEARFTWTARRRATYTMIIEGEAAGLQTWIALGYGSSYRRTYIGGQIGGFHHIGYPLTPTEYPFRGHT